MSILVLSNCPDNYSNTRFRRTADERGLPLTIVSPRDLELDVGDDGPRAFLRGRPLVDDVVLPRRGAATTQLDLAVVRHLESMGLPVVNASEAIRISRDKWETVLTLRDVGLGAPATALCTDESEITAALEAAGGLPVVVKTTSGTHGRGVHLVHTRRRVRALVRYYQRKSEPVLVQEFIRESQGRDRRAFVVGGRVVAAMERIAAKGDFRANYHRGGSAVAWEPDGDATQLALRAARAVGLEVAGVDFLVSDRGLLITELNSGPGFEALEAATGVDVAAAVLDHCWSKRPVGLAGPDAVWLGAGPAAEQAAETTSEQAAEQAAGQAAEPAAEPATGT